MFDDWLEYERECAADSVLIGWDHPEFEPIKQLLHEETEFITQSVQIEEGIECTRCKGTQTYTYQKQVRRADEGFTSFTVCFTCNYQLVE